MLAIRDRRLFVQWSMLPKTWSFAKGMACRSRPGARMLRDQMAWARTIWLDETPLPVVQLPFASKSLTARFAFPPRGASERRLPIKRELDQNRANSLAFEKKSDFGAAQGRVVVRHDDLFTEKRRRL